VEAACEFEALSMKHTAYLHAAGEFEAFSITNEALCISSCPNSPISKVKMTLDL